MSANLATYLIVLATVTSALNAHVAWLFPASWQPTFDSINFDEYVQPCGGVDADGDTRPDNIFIVGHQYELKWRMLYQHLGGFQINLLHSNGTKLKRLAPEANDSSNFFDTQMTQQQSISLKFDQVCSNCIIQLLKQANDLSDGYVYASCADIKILAQQEDKARSENDETECGLTRGWKTENRCVCDARHEGTYCENSVDCKADADCGKNGVCRAQENSDSAKVCYCAFGRHGKNCELESKIDLLDKCFNVRGPDSHNRMDFVSYGLFDESCYKQTNVAENDFVYSRVVKNQLEVILDFDTLSFAAIGWRPKHIDVKCRKFPLMKTERGGFLESAYNAPLHPMSCMDMVWGSVINETKLHIRDGYTRDRHTPLSDELYLNGENSVTAAFGIQIVNRTVIMFRRAIISQEPTDHPFGPNPLFGIYAKGQTHNERKWVVNQAFDAASNQNREFYREDELSYHGKNNRGVVQFEFFSQEGLKSSSISISGRQTIIKSAMILLLARVF